jgi:excisionase family DNA binding protein
MGSALSVRDVCERFGVTEHTVLSWIRSGLLKAINVGRPPERRSRGGGLRQPPSMRSRRCGRQPPPRPGRGGRSGRPSAAGPGGLDAVLKLLINTLYGVLTSRHFAVGNTVVSNNITARARLGAWMERVLGEARAEVARQRDEN